MGWCRGRARSAQALFFLREGGPLGRKHSLQAGRESVFAFCFFLRVGGPSAHKHNFWLYATICRIDSESRLCKRDARAVFRGALIAINFFG